MEVGDRGSFARESHPESYQRATEQSPRSLVTAVALHASPILNLARDGAKPAEFGDRGSRVLLKSCQRATDQARCDFVRQSDGMVCIRELKTDQYFA